MRRVRDPVARIYFALPILLGLWVLAISPPRSAEADSLGVISGRVVSVDDGLALQFATALVVGAKVGASTNRDGLFQIDHVPLGIHTLRVYLLGYKRLERSVTVMQGENALGTIALESDPMPVVGCPTVEPRRGLDRTVESASPAVPKAKASLLYAGERVRLSVSTPDLIRVLAGAPLTKKQLRRDQFVGTLQGRRDDDVVIRLESPETELAVPVKSVTRLQYSRGMGGCAVQGASIGIVAGAAGGVALALIACSAGDCESDGRTLIATLFGGVGAIAGAGIGAITGAQMRCERWQTVKIKDLPYGEGLPPENGIRLGLALPMSQH